MQLGSVFYGFNEGEISFAPTYRMVAGESKEYGNKRNQNPSYCDRVLWRSRQGLSDVLNLNAYEACWDMNKGDHRPVVAEFEMSTRKLYRFQGLEAERRLETGAIHITNLELYIDNEIVQSNYPCRIRFEGDVLRENVGTGIRVGSMDKASPSRTCCSSLLLNYKKKVKRPHHNRYKSRVDRERNPTSCNVDSRCDLSCQRTYHHLCGSSRE